jgi:hypothetical protein
MFLHTSKAETTELTKGLVVVELFTSQGCSSCPPADRLLASLAKDNTKGTEVIILSEHVDYWDYLGWKDPFSSPFFTERQHSYARALRQNNVYTPEMVVDGINGFVGSNEGAAVSAIQRAGHEPKVRLSLSAVEDSSKTSVDVVLLKKPEISKAERLLVFLTQDDINVLVGSGENSGQTLRHSGVVRHVKVIGKTSDSTIKLPKPSNSSARNLRVVAVLQNVQTMRITGAGITSVASR